MTTVQNVLGTRLANRVLEGWARDLRPLEEYPAGSSGPA
jgi:hypothetical protein